MQPVLTEKNTPLRPKTANKIPLKNRVVNIQFKDSLSPNTLNQIKDRYQSFYSNNDWRVSFKEAYNKLKPQELFEASQVILVNMITFHHCKQSTILMSLSGIQFPRLTVLSIPGNKISSIESLKFISLPFLKTLDLSYNTFSTILPLSRTQCPKLESIFVGKSSQTKAKELRRWQLSPNLERFELSLINHSIHTDFLEFFIFRQKWPKQSTKVIVYNSEIETNDILARSSLKSIRKRVKGDKVWFKLHQFCYYRQF